MQQLNATHGTLCRYGIRVWPVVNLQFRFLLHLQSLRRTKGERRIFEFGVLAAAADAGNDAGRAFFLVRPVICQASGVWGWQTPKGRLRLFFG